MLVFSIVYWLAVVVGIILFSLSFQRVPIGSYALRANSFSPEISPIYYTSGLYDAGVGYYFILFPSTRQCLIDNKVTVINQNLQKLVVTYTLCYRYFCNELDLTPIRYTIFTRHPDMTMRRPSLHPPM